MNKIEEELRELLGPKLSEFESKVNEGSSVITLLTKSPSSELGVLSVQITEDEIIIRVREFHTHISSSAIAKGESASIASLAMDVIEKIFDGKYYFFEIYEGKTIQSSGGGPHRLNEEEKKLLGRMFGPKVSIKEWNWFGAL